MNWKSLFFNSQSNPGLAVSGDLSDEEEEFRIDDDDDDDVISTTSIIKINSNSSESVSLSASSESEMERSYISSSVSLKMNSLLQNNNLKLSWQRSWFLIPSYSLIFLTVLPFVQGCLYTIGHRLGKKTLKFIFNKI